MDLLHFFLKKKKASGSGIKNENISDQQFAEELNKPLIRIFSKREVQSHFIDNIWVLIW